MTRRGLLGGLAAATATPLLSCGAPAHAPTRRPVDEPLVAGPGAWCWFQSPRAAIDASGSLWLGTSQGSGAPTPGSVDVTQVHLGERRVVARHRLGVDRVDDHTSPSVLATDAGVQVGWAAHRRVDWLELGTLGEPLQRITRPGALTPPGRGTSYVSAHVVGDERWVLYRGEAFSWNLLTSIDGRTWVPRGLVVAPPAGGHRPYLLAASDGDRLHVLVSDGNPSEFRGTGVRVATIDADLAITTGAGRPVGAVGSDAPGVSALELLASGAAGTDEALDIDIWPCDLRAIDGRPVGVVSVRDPWPDEVPAVDRTGRWRHAYRWAQQGPDGTWAVEHLAWAGSELYRNQPDYTGLATIDPHDAARVVISTDVHPTTGAPLVSAVDGLVHHELFEGRRHVERWTWRAITANSHEDNLRPLIVRGGGLRATAWMRGTYRSWTDFDTHLVVRVG